MQEEAAKSVGIFVGGLLKREIECAFFLHVVFPQGEGRVMEFLDINPVIGRITAGTFVEPEEDTETGQMSRPVIKRTPWRDRPPTMTGSSKIVTRYKLEEPTPDSSTCWVIRPLDAIEYCQLNCWSDGMHRLVHNDAWEALSQHEQVECVANLMGNAFTPFHYVPWETAAYATWGRFASEDGAKEEDIQLLEDDDEEDGCSCDCSLSDGPSSD